MTRAQTPCRLPSFFLMLRRPPSPTLFPYTTLFRSQGRRSRAARRAAAQAAAGAAARPPAKGVSVRLGAIRPAAERSRMRSEEHTSELQSRPHLVCRLLLEKKKR